MQEEVKINQFPEELEEILGEIYSQPLMHQLARTSWALKLAFEKRSEGLSGPLMWILLLLAKKDGLTQSDLTKILRVDASATTRMVKAMESEGWIRRETDPADNRRTLVYLTEAGRTKTIGMADLSHGFETDITAVLSSEQLEMLRSALKLLEKRARNVSSSPALVE